MIVQSGARSARRSRFLGAAFPPFSRPLLKLVTAASLAGLASAPAIAGSQLPTGGTVASGNVTIGTPANNSLTVTQTSSKAIVNWQGFSIGSANTVTFDNGSGATLNRVTGSAQSNIDGTLNATGSVYLLNPNGVVIGQSGVVNVGKNFVASTLGTSNAQFNASGPLTLNGNSQASVVNLGKIGSLGGDVALVAQQTLNAGTISAPQGSAGVLTGTQVTLRDSALDDGKFKVDVGNASNQAVNQGNISAAEAELKANGGNVYALAGNTSGVIAATGVATNDGKVFLTAGDTGSVTTNATITAQTSSSGVGGEVETSGGTVNVAGAHITAGTWLVDPVDLDVDAAAATTIDTALNDGTDVTLKTTATGSSGAGTVVNPGNGDIVINADISWSSDNNLTLSAYRNVSLNANIADTPHGHGNVTLAADNTGTGTGTVSFGAGDSIATSGAINIFYNPVNYDTPTDFSGIAAFPHETINAYMLVNTAAQLQSIGTDPVTLSGTYALGKNIDMTGVTFASIGDSTTPFTGLFDGQGNTIANLAINALGSDDIGLFGDSSGTIRNLTIDNFSVKGRFNVGGVVGITTGLIDDVTATSSVDVSGTELIGGLVGFLQHTGPSDVSTISNSHSAASVEDAIIAGGNGYFGGVVGEVDAGATVNDTTSSGLVTGSAGDFWVGGLAGRNDGTMTSDSTTASIDSGTGSSSLGGLVGANFGAISDSNANVTIDIGATSVGAIGGLAGFNNGTIDQSSATGTIQTEQPSAQALGGLVGENGASGQVTNSISTADVTGAYYVGGLVGWNLGTISGGNAGGCGCSGSVTGFYATGGLVGWNQGSVANSDATLPVFSPDAFFSTSSTTGGLVGLNDVGATITESTSSGGVDGDTILGGLVGANAGTITNSQSSSIVTGTNNDIGGLVGTNLSGGSVTFSFSSGTAQGGSGAANVGGLVGLNQGEILNTGSTADASSGFDTGGLVGTNDTTGTVTDSWAIGDVFGGDDAGGLAGANKGSITGSWSGTAVHGSSTEAGTGTGGLVGTNDTGATITYSYAVGTVSSLAGPAGGLIGNNLGSADNVYATGKISGTPSVTGGLVADNSAGTLSSAYWDTATTTQANAVGVSGTETNVNSVSASDNSAYAQASYANFDFTAGTGHWFMIDGETRPFLQAEAWSTGANQYLITNAHQLQLIAMAPNASYQLTGSDADIDASATSQTAFGSANNMWTAAGFVPIASFGGTFDGQGGAIDGLFMSRSTTDDVGLFAQIGVGGTVSNLALTNVDIGGQNNVGALAGLNYGTIEGDYADGGTPSAAAVTGTGNVGGLVGTNEQGGVITQAASGPLGLPVPTETFVSVSGSGDNVGGLVGLNADGGAISDSLAGGSFVDGNNNVGGLVGQNNGAISASSSSTQVTAFAQDAGGLVGLSIQGAGPDAPQISTSYATGTVTAPSNAGGLVGDADQNSVIESSYASGDVSGTAATGGLIGSANGATITDVYALGSVTQSDPVNSVWAGGLIGVALPSTIDSGYASGAVSSATGNGVGGLIGMSIAATATNLYWDEDTTGQFTPGATFTGSATPVGINNTGLDAYNSSSYSGLNDGNWLFVDGILGGEGARPMLAMEYSTTITNAHQLQLMATQPNAAYVLGNDFDASATATGTDVWSSEGFSPIFSFGGTLEGNGFQIDGLTVNRPSTNSQGIFDMIAAGAAVTDLAMVDFSITGNDRAGALAGTNFGTIANDVVAGGSVTGRNYVGGLVGSNRAGAILGGVYPSAVPDLGLNGSNIVEYTQVTGNDRVGGLAGYNAGTIGSGSTTDPESMSGSFAFVNGGDQVGGVVGWNDGTIDSVIGANLDVEGTGYGVGGIVGDNTQHASLRNSQAIAFPFGPAPDTVGASSGNGIGGAVGVNSGTLSNVLVQDIAVGNSSATTVGGLVASNLAGGSVTGGEVDNADVAGLNTVGGFAGSNAGLIANSTANAQVNGTGYVGGFVGSNLADGVLNTDSANTTVDATGDRVGGFAGWNAGQIGVNSSASGDVSGKNQTGGFVGWNDGAIDSSQASVDTVSSTGYATGGFAGYNTGTGSITSSTATGTGSATVGGGSETGAVGGFVGDNKGSIESGHVVGIAVNDTTVSNVAGFTGKNEFGATIDTSTVDSTSSVEGGAMTGGFVGSNAGSAHASQSDASVTGTTYVGGFAGQGVAGGSMKDDTATGTVTATANYAGGFVGANAGSSIDSSATGNVRGASYTGGFSGWNQSTGTLEGSGASGTVGGVSNVGGLVGRNDGSIDNASVTLTDVEGTGYAIGGLVGFNSASGTAHDFTVTGSGAATIGTTGGGIGGAVGDNAGDANDDTVVGLFVGTGAQTTIGGYVGKNEAGASISGGSVDSTTSVSGLNTVGGFAGYNAGSIGTSQSDAGVQGANYVGGFSGTNASGGGLTSDKSTGTTVGSGARIGGLVGWNAGTISKGEADGSTTGVNQTGGLVGWNDGGIGSSTATGHVSASGYAAGGLVGYATATSALNDVSASGNVDGSGGGMGGLVGSNAGSVTNAYAIGSVGAAGTHTVGGLIGVNSGALLDIYAAGPVTGAAGVGALIGTNQASGTVANGYYDTLVTGSLTSIAVNYNSAGAHPHALTALRPPTSQSSYAGFDFTNHWTVQPGQTPTLVNHP